MGTYVKHKTERQLIESGMKIGDSKIFQEDMIWSRYSNDKVDIGEALASVSKSLE